MNPLYRAAMTAIDEGALVLTANRRLERHLRSCFDRRMEDRGVSAWRTPKIFSFDEWVSRTVAETGEGWRLLDPFSARHLWETVIEADGAGTERDLLQVPATARRAMEAHGLLTDYGVDLAPSLQTEDQAAFSRWREDYLEACRLEGWLDPAGAPDWVAKEIEDGRLVVPNRLLLAGFDEVRPSVRRLAGAFAATGARMDEAPPIVEPRGDLVRLRCLDSEDEIRRAVRWARRLVEGGGANIGIVVPRLTQWRATIERMFREEVEPDSLLPGNDEASRFGLSLGRKLSDQGPVVAALEILSVDRRLPMDKVSYLLRTPYLGGYPAEGSRRALFERELRTLRLADFSLDRLQALAVRSGQGPLPRFEIFCREASASLKGDGNLWPSQWVEQFSRLLDAVGWPGERGLDSHEYQISTAWREKLLPQLVRLDRVSRPMTRSRALGLLRGLAAEIDFQPEAPASPIQVIGYLEAAGLRFDHLWVMDLCEDVLPAPAAPNPFIPFRLQSAHRMPHADASREMEFARLVTDRLFAAAPEVVLSHPGRRGDCEQRPSPLIRDVPAGEVDLEPSRRPAEVIPARPVALQGLLDWQGPALAGQSPAEGGTAILRDQALCPFRAFAHHRLGARALEEPELGFDARTRGTLLHAVLEIFWAGTKNRENLLELPPETRRQRLMEAIEEALTRKVFAHLSILSGALLDLEKERLLVLTEEWLLAVDMDRPPFEVLEREEEHQGTFGGTRIRTKIDRLDRTGDDDLLVIDYKTGRIDFEDLLGERLLEPQLPVYGVGEAAKNLAGVAFAVVRRGDCSLRGLCREADLFPGGEPFAGSRLATKYGIDSWDELLDRWRRQLEGLGSEFSGGEASVRPVAVEKACRYCDLASFCRIDENRLEVPR